MGSQAKKGLETTAIQEGIVQGNGIYCISSKTEHFPNSKTIVQWNRPELNLSLSVFLSLGTVICQILGQTQTHSLVILLRITEGDMKDHRLTPVVFSKLKQSTRFHPDF